MTTTERPSVDEVLVDVARAMARRGTCSRARVGAVLALDGRVCATGHNGAPRGFPHCDHTGEPPDAPTCPTAVHAEANALVFAARHGVSIQGATLYCTHTPCSSCAMLLVNAYVTRVVCAMRYRDPMGVHVLREAGVGLWVVENGTLECWIES